MCFPGETMLAFKVYIYGSIKVQAYNMDGWLQGGGRVEDYVVSV